MARSALTDYLQAYPFWLMDVAPVEGFALPVFTPLSGFQTITAPEINIEMHDIQEGNWYFKRSVIKSADAAQITLTRGVTFANSDFWRWTIASVVGNTDWQLRIPFMPPSRIGGPTPRRQLILVHYFARNPFGSAGAALAAISTGLAAAVGVANVSGSVAGAGAGAAALAATGAAAITGGGPFDFAARIPARAYVLHDCLPTRYKVGSDFDAASGEVSIAELDIKPELIEEISLTA